MYIEIVEVSSEHVLLKYLSLNSYDRKPTALILPGFMICLGLLTSDPGGLPRGLCKYKPVASPHSSGLAESENIRKYEKICCLCF